MIAEQHYSDDVLIGMLGEAAVADPHLPACTTCAAKLESLRGLSAGLYDKSVWDERELSDEPKPQTISALRSFAAKAKAEDAAAGPIVARLLAATSRERGQLLSANPEFRTGGVVRKIIEAVLKTNFVDPKTAGEWARLATQIAELLDPSRYPFDTVAKLRVSAWRELAYALYYVGSYPEALAALDRMDECLDDCTVSDYDKALALIYRGHIFRLQERFDDALEDFGQARRIFEAYGDRQHLANTLAGEATVLITLRRFSAALEVLLGIANDSSLDRESRACALTNAGFCYRELSKFADARRVYGEAVVTFETLGLVARRAIARLGIARVVLDEGHFEQALQSLTQLRSEFEEAGMSQDVALVSLFAADALLALEQPGRVAELCRFAIDYFRKAGLAYSESAMTALAYLREAAEQGTITPATVDHVRSFFEILPKQPELLFAYPA